METSKTEEQPLRTLPKDVIIYKLFPLIQEPLIEANKGAKLEALKWKTKFDKLISAVKAHDEISLCYARRGEESCDGSMIGDGYCDKCGQMFCDDHLELCVCDQLFCHTCIECCFGCTENMCEGCLTRCDFCQESKCEDCTVKCDTCQKSVCGCKETILQTEDDRITCNPCARKNNVKCEIEDCKMTGMFEDDEGVLSSNNNGQHCVYCAHKWVCETHAANYFIKISNRNIFECGECLEKLTGKREATK